VIGSQTMGSETIGICQMGPRASSVNAHQPWFKPYANACLPNS
jgi:hypothetical protein